MDEDFERAKSLAAFHDDPLSIYLDRLNHLRTQKSDWLSDHLHTTTRQFIEDPRYRQDLRYLRLWIEAIGQKGGPEQQLAAWESLGNRGIGSTLAAFYEEYAAALERAGHIERAGRILKRGIDVGAQPLERLKATYKAFQSRCEASKQPIERKEMSAYNSLIVEGGAISFEEARARHPRYLSRSNIAGTANVNSIVNNNNLIQEDDDEDVPSLAVSINPDDLTHISVYRDTTADIAQMRATQSREQKQTTNEEEDPFAEIPAVVHNVTPLLDPERRHWMEEEGIDLVAIGSVLTAIPETALAKLRSLDRSISRQQAGETVAALRIGSRQYFCQGRLYTAAIPSLTASAGSSSLYLCLPLDHQQQQQNQSDDHSNTLVVIKAVSPPTLWEPWCMVKLQNLLSALGSRVPALAPLALSFVPCLDCIRYNDVTYTVTPHYPAGSLKAYLPQSDPLIGQFWTRELIRILLVLFKCGLAHGRLSPDHLLVRLGSSQETQRVHFQPDGSGGWDGWGLALLGFSKAVDLKLLDLPDWIRKDWRDALEIVKQLLTNKTDAIWATVQAGLSDPSPSAAILEGILEIVEASLLQNAHVAVPSLKNRLQRLEIGVLEGAKG